MADFITVRLAALGTTVKNHKVVDVVVPDGSKIQAVLNSVSNYTQMTRYKDLRMNGKPATPYDAIRGSKNIITMDSVIRGGNNLFVDDPEDVVELVDIDSAHDLITMIPVGRIPASSSQGISKKQKPKPEITKPEPEDWDTYTQRFLLQNPDFLEVD